MSDEKRSIAALQDALSPDFDVKSQLGRGSTATVYKAWENGLDRYVAIKVLHAHLVTDETARIRFERAAKAAASLDHPNVAHVHRLGRLPDETPYLVMHLVNGRTMQDRLAAEGTLSPELAIPVLTDLAAALTEAHSHDIVHRDVRPENVLWDEKNEKALLVDFGLAALLATTGEELTRITKTGQLLGDPRYLSPEQLLDDRITVLSDIYGFGVMAYELLTGDGPFDARTNGELIQAHVHGEPKDLGELRPDLDSNIANVVRRCLNREPKHRPAASDISRALRGEWQVGPPVSSVPPGPHAEKGVMRGLAAGLVISGSVIGSVATLNEQYEGSLPDWAFTVALATGAAIMLGSLVVGWFHGDKGRQRVPVAEYLWLGLIVAGWLATSLAIIVSWG
jgi:eukaryotic-like serine/threonine-protein kinase